MSTMLPPQSHSSEALRVFSAQREAYRHAAASTEFEEPKVLITGDIRLYVTERDAALHPITGHYSIQTTGMGEFLHTLWHAEGQVLCRQTRSTSIAFDMRDARAGETWTYLVAVQVTESGVEGRVVQSGVFVQITVTNNAYRKLV